MDLPQMPYPFRISREKLAEEATEEKFNEWEAEVEQYNAAVRAMNDERKKLFGSLNGIAVELFGRNHRVSKHLRRQSVPFVSGISLDDLRRDVKKIVDQRGEEQRQLEAQRAFIENTVRATAWLIARGKKLDVDFTGENAVSAADTLAFEEEKQRQIKLRADEASEDYISNFDGKNCDDCPGWDGVSSRCACGNRRVCWEMCDWHSFERPAIRGVAY